MKIPQHWTFKTAEVAAGFDEHVREQLPWYDLATEFCSHIAAHYIPERGLVYDIGASTGNITRALRSTLEAQNARAVSIDPSSEMLANFRGYGDFEVADAQRFEYAQFDVAILFLSLMFIPVSARVPLLQRLRTLARPGGAIIVFDKTLPSRGQLGTANARFGALKKIQAGATAEKLYQKDMSLIGVQRPIALASLPNAQEIFRFGDFVGLIEEIPETQ